MNNLYFKPDKITVKKGEPFDLEVWMDTGEHSISGADIIIPLKGLEATKLTSMGVFSIFPVSKITAEKIIWSGIIPPGTEELTAHVAILKLTLIAQENTTLEFHEDVGMTTYDSNLADYSEELGTGVDIIESVGLAEITIEENNMTVEELKGHVQTFANEHNVKVTVNFTAIPVPEPEDFEVSPE